MSHQTCPQKPVWPDHVIFTVGHSTLPIERFMALLCAYGIQSVVDIRTVPHSRHNPQFDCEALADALKKAGIEYIHLRALGGLRRAWKDSPNTGWQNEGFRGYADYMQTEEFSTGLDELIRICDQKRAAIMCAEAVPWHCHRSLVADALIVRDIPVVEILSDTEHRTHTLTPFARVEGTTIIYPPEHASLL